MESEIVVEVPSVISVTSTGCELSSTHEIPALLFSLPGCQAVVLDYVGVAHVGLSPRLPTEWPQCNHPIELKPPMAERSPTRTFCESSPSLRLFSS